MLKRLNEQNEKRQIYIKNLVFTCNKSYKIPRFFFSEFHERVKMFSQIENDANLKVKYLILI